ncbi:condensation domain-containing protein [Raineyella sp.]|uniref:condensation domain-containing protein n=1 Tax=Raineyella sp. TaxID=1911550 RepID=UPI003A5217FD
MTSAQRGIYFQWLLEPESAYYNYQVLLECPPTLDVDKARRALDQALRANPQLFAQFEVDPSGSFVQTFPVDPIQARSVRACEAESEAEARRRCRERVARPFDLECGSSLVVDEIRIKSGSTWFVLTMNEILIDGWGAMKFAEQMADFYLSADPEAEEAVVAERIRSVVEYFQNAVDDGPLTPEAQEFWAVSLDGVKPGSPLRDTDDPGYNPYAASITEISLDGASTQAIRSAAQALESSPFAIFVAAYALALATTSDQDDFVVGAPVAGRQHEGTDDLPTLMLNMVAIRVLLDRNQASLDAVRTLTTSTTNATAFSDSRFGAVVAEFAAHTNDDPLFSTMVNMLTYPTSEVWVGSGSLRLIELDTGFTKYDGSLYVQRHGEDYTLQIAHKLAHVTPERARTVLALTAWYLTSDWLSPTVSVAGLIASAQAALDVSRTATLPMPAPEDGGDCAPAA